MIKEIYERYRALASRLFYVAQDAESIKPALVQELAETFIKTLVEIKQSGLYGVEKSTVEIRFCLKCRHEVHYAENEPYTHLVPSPVYGCTCPNQRDHVTLTEKITTADVMKTVDGLDKGPKPYLP